VRGTQRKGDIATARAVASFTAMDYDVSIPLTESAAYDLIVDDGRELYRVQCKYAASREVDLRRIHTNAGGYVVKPVAPNAYDWLYVLRPDGSEYLLRECHAGRRSVTPQVEHLFGAVAESG
jgi:PD-(D/E)XK endonuclease